MDIIDINAVIERELQIADGETMLSWDGDARDRRKVVAALVQLREENARLDRERESNWILANSSRVRAERAEARVAELVQHADRLYVSIKLNCCAYV
jgi:hypothetical protein